MACFLIPAAEAVVVTTAYFVAKHRENKNQLPKHTENTAILPESIKVTVSKKLSWLLGLLWGGVLLLAFEHFWHGEIVPYAPFLTAMSNPDDKAAMLHEMATVGVSMAASVTAFWGAICIIADAKVKKIRKVSAKAVQGTAV